MHLVIHAGTHKTGTTLFQNFCADNSNKLIKKGIFYPTFDDISNHSIYLWHKKDNDQKKFSKFLKNCFKKALNNSHTVLISAEDLENCLIDVNKGREIEKLAFSIGFTKIDWFFVQRNKIDYAKSIYAEMSKHNVFWDFELLVENIIKNEFIRLDSEFYDYYFVFNVKKNIQILGNKCLNSNFHLLEMSDFLKEYPGEKIINKALEFKKRDLFIPKKHKLKFKTINKKNNILKVEFEYFKTLLREISGYNIRRFKNSTPKTIFEMIFEFASIPLFLVFIIYRVSKYNLNLKKLKSIKSIY